MILKHRIGFSAALAVTMLSVACAAQPNDNALIGTWTVVEVRCETCQTRTNDEVGKTIQFSASAISNFVTGEACTKAPRYDLIKPVDTDVLIRSHRYAWPVIGELGRAITAPASAGFVTCDGINFMDVAVYGDGGGLWFAEGGLIFRLRRTSGI